MFFFLAGDVFGPLEFSRRDLMALNIQRARDHGLGDYNTAREEYGLPRITNWTHINPALAAEKPEVRKKRALDMFQILFDTTRTTNTEPDFKEFV